jgi:hypothetical protein
VRARLRGQAHRLPQHPGDLAGDLSLVGVVAELDAQGVSVAGVPSQLGVAHTWHAPHRLEDRLHLEAVRPVRVVGRGVAQAGGVAGLGGSGTSGTSGTPGTRCGSIGSVSVSSGPDRPSRRGWVGLGANGSASTASGSTGSGKATSDMTESANPKSDGSSRRDGWRCVGMTGAADAIAVDGACDDAVACASKGRGAVGAATGGGGADISDGAGIGGAAGIGGGGAGGGGAGGARGAAATGGGRGGAATAGGNGGAATAGGRGGAATAGGAGIGPFIGGATPGRTGRSGRTGSCGRAGAGTGTGLTGGGTACSASVSNISKGAASTGSNIRCAPWRYPLPFTGSIGTGLRGASSYRPRRPRWSP